MTHKPNFDDKGRALTWLEVPFDAVDYVKRHGAKWSGTFRAWYVFGEPPAELLNFLPAPARSRAPDNPVLCPLCGSGMARCLSRKDMTYFWGCMRWRSAGCPGRLSHDAYLDYTDQQSKSAADWIADKLFVRQEVQRPSTDRETYTREDLVDLLAVAISMLGGPEQVLKWLTTVKVGLGYRTPISCMGTEQGRHEIKQLLLTMRA